MLFPVEVILAPPLYTTSILTQITCLINGQRILTKGCIAGERIYLGGRCNVTPSMHCSRLQQSRCRAVIEDRMIPFAAYTVAKTPNAFQ